MLPICYLDHESVIPSLFFALLKDLVGLASCLTALCSSKQVCLQEVHEHNIK